MSTSAEGLPIRIAIGAYIVNAGVGKLSADAETVTGLHGMATGTYPFLAKVPAERFVKLLAISEIALGSTLLAPVVSSRLAGAGLSAFASGLLGMYLRTPGMRRDRSLRPSAQGSALAKDVWLLGAGFTLMALGRRRKS